MRLNPLCSSDCESDRRSSRAPWSAVLPTGSAHLLLLAFSTSAVIVQRLSGWNDTARQCIHDESISRTVLVAAAAPSSTDTRSSSVRRHPHQPDLRRTLRDRPTYTASSTPLLREKTKPVAGPAACTEAPVSPTRWGAQAPPVRLRLAKRSSRPSNRNGFESPAHDARSVRAFPR